MAGTGIWIFGGVTGILGLFGLMVASHAHEAVFYWAGLVLFVFATFLVLATIKQGFDRQEALGH